MTFLQNKFRLKALLAGYERNSIVIVADGLVNHRAKRLILKDLKSELQKYSRLCRLKTDEVHMLWNGSYKILNSTAKKTWGKKSSDEIYTVLRHELIYSGNFTHMKNQVANRHEEMAKHDYLMDMMDNSVTPFYLSDAHKDCAKGHLDYQNKLYYDADYSSRYGFDSETISRIENYISKHKLMSVQEVTGDGIWLVTRPNCRHELHPVPMEDVLHGKKLQKISEPGNLPEKKSYEYGEMEFYYERSRILESLRDVIPCKKLDEDYSRTNKLVRKWRNKKNQRL